MNLLPLIFSLLNNKCMADKLFSQKYSEGKFFESLAMAYFTCSGAMAQDIDVNELNQSDDIIDSIIDDYTVVSIEISTQ